MGVATPPKKLVKERKTVMYHEIRVKHIKDGVRVLVRKEVTQDTYIVK